MNKKSKKQLLLSAICVGVLVVLDQITKYLAVIFLKGQAAIPIIKNVFELQYLENTSAAFGMDPVSLLHNIFHFEVFASDPEVFLSVRMGFFIAFTLVMIFLFAFLFAKIPNDRRYIFIDIILIFFTAGALGNFIDRIVQQYVIDFLYFKLIDFPIFNVADIYVTCAAFAMLFLGIFYYTDDDFEIIFPSLKSKEKKNK